MKPDQQVPDFYRDAILGRAGEHMNDEPKIVQAVGTVAGAGPGVTPEELEQAMAAAVLQAMEEGVTDPDEIRRRQLEARDKVVKAHETK